jgi:hypothetical protein
MEKWFEQYIFEYHHENPVYDLAGRAWNALLTSDFDSEMSQDILNRTHLEYFVTLKNNSTAFNAWGRVFDSPFIRSMMNSSNATSAFETESLIVWKIIS